MTTIEILSKAEVSEFNSPPHFPASDRGSKFYTSKIILEEISKIRLHKNRIGFLLQYGYFKATGQFFHPRKFNKQDVKHVTKKLKLKCTDWKASEYSQSRTNLHKQQILSISKFVSFNTASKNLLIHEAQFLTSKNTKPQVIFEWLVSYLRKHKIEVPSYSPIAKIITNALNKNEDHLLELISQNITIKQRELLDAQLVMRDDTSDRQVTPLTLLKKLNQSSRATKLKISINSFETLKGIHSQISNILKLLNLPPEVIRLYADYTLRSKSFQLLQFRPEKRYLYLIIFIAYQYNKLHDTLIDHLIQTVQTANHSALSKFRDEHFITRKDQYKTINPFHSHPIAHKK